MVLKEKEGERRIPIWIGALEAYSISIALERIPFPRPLTHDLFLMAFGKLGASLKSVSITGLALNTFFAKLEVQKDKEMVEFDARPSDAIGLALRASAPIFASEELFELDINLPPEYPEPPTAEPPL